MKPGQRVLKMHGDSQQVVGCLTKKTTPREAHRKALGVKTTHQMTRFRDGRVFKNFATDEIDDHRTQSDHKWTTKIQKERTLHLAMRLRGETEHDTNDNVTTKTWLIPCAHSPVVRFLSS